MEGEASSEFGQELAHDLRQTYAKIVGDHLQDIAEARKQENYYLWFKNMEDLHIVIHHKFKKEEKDEEEYQKKVKAIIKLAIENRNVWLGKDKENSKLMDIQFALGDLEMFLYDKMDKAKMFGQSGYIPGL